MTSFFKSRHTAHIERLERFIASQDRLITESARNLCQLSENAISQDDRIASLEEAVKIDLQHSQRINELEQQSANQLRRIENLEGCIRTQAENQRKLADELSRVAVSAQRWQPLGPGPLAPVNPGPSPFWGGSSGITLAQASTQGLLLDGLGNGELQEGKAPR